MLQSADRKAKILISAVPSLLSLEKLPSLTIELLCLTKQLLSLTEEHHTHRKLVKLEGVCWRHVCWSGVSVNTLQLTTGAN